MKYRIKKLFVLMPLIVGVLFSFSGCKSCWRVEWEQVYDAYTQEEGGKFKFYNLNATIIDFENFRDKVGIAFKLSIDKEDFYERYKAESQVEWSYYEFQRLSFYFVDESITILEEAGFFDDIKEDTVITFTVNDYIGWDGWCYPGGASKNTRYCG